MRSEVIIAAVLMMALVPPAFAMQTFVAQEDPLWIEVSKPGGSCWFFAESSGRQSDKLFDIRSVDSGNMSYCMLDGSMTGGMSVGKYTLVYQEPLITSIGSSILDVKYNATGKTFDSMLATTEKVSVSSMQPPEMKKALLKIIDEDKMNVAMQYSLEIEEPSLKITSIRPVSDVVFNLKGTCNFANNTEVTIKVDELESFAKHDGTMIFHTKVERSPIESEGHWGINMTLPINDMAPGWHSVNVYSRNIQTSVRFPLYTTFADMPHPNNTINYLGDGNIAPKIINVTITVPVTQYVDRWHTATPTPAITDAIGGKIPYPYSRGYESSPQMLMVMIATLGIVVVIRRKI